MVHIHICGKLPGTRLEIGMRAKATSYLLEKRFMYVCMSLFRALD